MAPDVSVVGAGPNGLAAAVVLARAGLSVEVHEAAETIGGGSRSARLFDSGVVHDICAAVHPLAVASPFLRGFGLEERVELCYPEIAYGHPVDAKRTGLAYADLARTCERLGPDGARWRSFMEPLVSRTHGVVELLLGDVRHPPRDLLAAVLVAKRILVAASPVDVFRGPEASALLAGVGAHTMTRLPGLAAAGATVLLAHLAHASGWPVPRGGSQAIPDALADDLLAHGGRIFPGSRITDLRALASSRAVVLDLAPRGFLDIAGPLLPAGYRRALTRYRYGPGAAKVDFLVSEPIPWLEPELWQAGTVHIGGTRSEVFAAENSVVAGRRAVEPFTLVSEPMIVDPSRGLPAKRPVWAYCHVPHGDSSDPTDVVRRRIERFAPGFSDIVLASASRPASEMESYNGNYVGGDIAAGACDLRQMFARPAARWNPYATPLSGVYLCSSATPPGPGVHGMGGLHAANSVLRKEFGIRELPIGWR